MSSTRAEQLIAEAESHEREALKLRRLANAAGVREREEAMRKAAETPVDRNDQTLTDGRPVPGDGSHTALKPNGQQQDYVVLSEAERRKGFVRPVRDAYREDM